MVILLSIIVPIYNVESYLHKCIDSLLFQDLPSDEYEIILVDDESPDKCGMICEEYVASYANIRVVHRKNGGLSAARNSGIKNANGKYIMFVDSDDYLEPNVLKTLVNKMESDNLDILRFNYQNVNEQYLIFNPNKSYRLYTDYRDEICDGLTFLTERLGYACYAVQFMIKSELLNHDGNSFKVGMFFEDAEWVTRILVQARRVTSIDFVAYNYLIRQGSITNSVTIEKKRKVLEDKFLLIETLKEHMVDKLDTRWYKGMISITVISILGYISDDFYNEKEPYLKRIKEMNVLPLSSYHQTKNASRKIKVINFSPMFFCWLLHKKCLNKN